MASTTPAGKAGKSTARRTRRLEAERMQPVGTIYRQDKIFTGQQTHLHASDFTRAASTSMRLAVGHRQVCGQFACDQLVHGMGKTKLER